MGAERTEELEALLLRCKNVFLNVTNLDPEEMELPRPPPNFLFFPSLNSYGAGIGFIPASQDEGGELVDETEAGDGPEDWYIGQEDFRLGEAGWDLEQAQASPVGRHFW